MGAAPGAETHIDCLRRTLRGWNAQSSNKRRSQAHESLDARTRVSQADHIRKSPIPRISLATLVQPPSSLLTSPSGLHPAQQRPVLPPLGNGNPLCHSEILTTLALFFRCDSLKDSLSSQHCLSSTPQYPGPCITHHSTLLAISHD